MKAYISSKVVQARPMTSEEFGEKVRAIPNLRGTVDGYYLLYPDGYPSWIPKEEFERVYRELSRGELQLCQH